ncbi:general transcription factor 3C polypeptide 1 [Teleopsis dalmanni]|uniref:general transcription factor 3C polypeptide 1 n=1 Tax=Teleopsis dalmanni TaxID=139649 RepID=UPI0018CE3F28|nr:general transcription factor 3C polypeptide 1 [Teleopsis dalmanni]
MFMILNNIGVNEFNSTKIKYYLHLWSDLKFKLDRILLISATMSISRIILEEIALEGLEGVTLASLWLYLSEALKLPYPFNSDCQEQIWDCIKNSRNLLFYELPVERPPIKLYDRFADLDPCLGVPLVKEVCPLVRYKFNPIQTKECLGSCEYFNERKPIPNNKIADLNVTDVINKWGDKFVIVGNQELRYSALTPLNVQYPKDLTAVQYCIWEAIGRSRHNGETTSGSFSLLNFCKDPTIVFYIKNKLLRADVIATQLFNEKVNDRLIVTTLVTLPRFHKTRKSMLYTVIEKVAELCKDLPNNRISMIDAHRHFPSVERHKSFRKMTMTHPFRQIFETISVPYAEYYKSTRKTSTDGSKGRYVLTIKLRNPDINLDNLYKDEQETEKEECVDKFVDNSHIFVDMPIKEQFYRAVARHGARGCSQSEICDYIGLNHLTTRQIVKKMEADGYIKSYCTDVGRQRIYMYVAIEHSETVSKNDVESKMILDNLQCSEEPNIPNNENVITMTDIISISSSIKPFEYVIKNNTRDLSTYKQVFRKATIVKCINKNCIIPVYALRYEIQRYEKEQNYADEVCFKSVARILHQLQKNKILNIYEITVQFEEYIRTYRYATHPKIDIEHEMLKREVLKLKNNLHLVIEERRLQAEIKAKKKRKAQLKLTKKPPRVKKVKVKENRSHKPPKFLISRYMHEFLFYIIVELNDSTPQYPISTALLQEWQITEPNLQVKEFMEQLANEENQIAYTKQISWRTFIPPLPKYTDKPFGWVYLMDAIDRIPLSLLQKIFCFEPEVDETLTPYLSHPVRQHYLLRQLSPDLQQQISCILLQKLYIMVLKLLNHMGLIQIGERLNVKDPLIMWVYLNRHAHILETTTSEPSYFRINPNRSYDTMRFEFNTSDDVNQYWTNLHRICIYTKLGFRRGTFERPGRIRELTFLDPVDTYEAPKKDDGTIPGDNLGAAGLSANLFAHTFRNWSWVVNTSTISNEKNTQRNCPVLLRGKLARHRPLRNRLIMPPIRRLQHGILAKAISAKKSGPRDAIDRDALKNMRTLRVSWSIEEDNMLKIARAVYLYVAAPVPALELLTVAKICRDVLRHTIGSNNKTMKACLRRTQFLVKMGRHLPEVPAWLNLLQSNEYMQNKYGDNFLQKLKDTYPIRNEFCDALVIHFVLILNFLYKLVKNTNAIDCYTFLIPDTIEEFSAKFSERITTSNILTIQNYNPNKVFDLQVSVVVGVLHSAMCCAKDKTLYNMQAFEIYKNYSEEVLNAAFSKARADTLVVAVKRKHLQLIPDQLAGPAYLLSSKYRFRLTYLKIPYNVYDILYAYFENALTTFFKVESGKDAKRYLELKTPNLGHLFFIAEGLAKNYWKSQIKLPINILTVDTQQAQNVSSIDRIFAHYHTIFDNAPKTEYAKNIENETTEKRIRIKFHPANLSYKIHYSPYDEIAKLPARYMHFFCALRHLDKKVDINFSKLCHENEENNMVIIECPFNCIMNGTNYVDAIVSIVNEKAYVLDELSEMPAQKLLNLAASGCSVTVQPANLLTLVRLLESFWREREQKAELKDLGKLQDSVKRIKTIDWVQICRNILEFSVVEFDSNQINELEPILNKEERILRAQDVFVVNLPALQFYLNPEFQTTTYTVKHNQLMIPKVMLETEVERENILQKVINESHWKYTENTFQMLLSTLNEENFNELDKNYLKDIHDFIETEKLGVTVSALMQKFPDQQLLYRALKILSDFYLIKRVGISTFVYVHKTHIRDWLVLTFHIKRLDREKLGDTNTTKVLKRPRTEENDEFDSGDSGSNKKQKTTENEETSSDTSQMQPSSSKRLPKPVQPFDMQSTVQTAKTYITKDTIAMRPQPWIRLNGSLNRRVLDKWIGSILAECLVRSGCFVTDILARFPHMYPVDLMFLLEILSDMKCIYLSNTKVREIDIFSEYEVIEDSIVSQIVHPSETYINTNPDALTRMAFFIGNKKYSADFI